jgi:hypothetical protein
MTGGQRVGWTLLAVLGGTALTLRVADALPGLLWSVPRGVHLCATLAEARARTGLPLTGLRLALRGPYDIAGSIATVTRPWPALSIRLRPASAGQAELSYFRTRLGEIPTVLRTPLSAFHAIEVTLAAGRPASLRTAASSDGTVWQEVEWREGEGRAALRTQGRTVDLLHLARQIVEEAP